MPIFDQPADPSATPAPDLLLVVLDDLTGAHDRATGPAQGRAAPQNEPQLRSPPQRPALPQPSELKPLGTSPVSTFPATSTLPFFASPDLGLADELLEALSDGDSFPR